MKWSAIIPIEKLIVPIPPKNKKYRILFISDLKLYFAFIKNENVAAHMNADKLL